MSVSVGFCLSNILRWFCGWIILRSVSVVLVLLDSYLGIVDRCCGFVVFDYGLVIVKVIYF